MRLHGTILVGEWARKCVWRIGACHTVGGYLLALVESVLSGMLSVANQERASVVALGGWEGTSR